MKKTAFVLLLLISIPVLTGCSSNKEYPVKIIEENGVKKVSNPAYPKEGVYDLMPEEMYTLGREEDNSKYIFSYPGLMELDSKDNLYVFDYDATKFFAFNSKGEFLYSFGKKGAGPGDTGKLAIFQISSTGKLIINDMSNRRFCIWDLSGKSLDNYPYNIFLNEFKLDSKDNLYSDTVERDISKLTDKDQKVFQTDIVVRYNPADNSWIPIRKFHGEYQKMSRTSNGGISGGGPYNQFIWKISSHDKLYAGNVDSYELSVFDLKGNPLLKFGKEYTRRPNPFYLKKRKQYEFLTAFTRFSVFDSAGNFWVNEDNGDSTNTYVYDVFSEDGIFQKQVYSKYKIHLFRGDKLYSFVQNPKEPIYVKALKYSLKRREK